MPWWERWASALEQRVGRWGVEILSGLLLASGVQVFRLLPGLDPLEVQIDMALGAIVGALFYEGVLDPNGFAWTDIGQRAVGILLGLAFWLVL